MTDSGGLGAEVGGNDQREQGTAVVGGGGVERCQAGETNHSAGAGDTAGVVEFLGYAAWARTAVTGIDRREDQRLAAGRRTDAVRRVAHEIDQLPRLGGGKSAFR